MPDDRLRYDRMVEDALRSVVSRALAYVAEQGLPGDHHFYITFRTDHPDVAIPERLRARYPGEMTIILQYQFWGLEVRPDAFSVTLSFSDVPERLTIPYEAVVGFADPSVRFGLQFDAGRGEEGETGAEGRVPGGAGQREADAANTQPEAAPEQPDPGAEVPAAVPDEASGKVITLDRFRKK
ncbi:MAG: SspB family protein [Kiloniellaceae bacterium]